MTPLILYCTENIGEDLLFSEHFDEPFDQRDEPLLCIPPPKAALRCDGVIGILRS